MSIADDINEVMDSVLPNAPPKRPMRTKSQQLRARIAKGGCYLAVSVQVEHRKNPVTGLDEVLRTPYGKGSVITRKEPKKLSKVAKRKLEAQRRKDANRAS